MGSKRISLPTCLPGLGSLVSTQPDQYLAIPQEPDFLIVGLFALRLAKHVIEGLVAYDDRDADIAWLESFLARYPAEYALAKITGHRKHDYIETYHGIVSRMTRQPHYPVRFMQMNPDKGLWSVRTSREHGYNMTDGTLHPEMCSPLLAQLILPAERIAIINFCDAASEWGSIVPIPAHEAERMIELANQRHIADVEDPRHDQPNAQMVQTERSLLARLRNSSQYQK